MRQDTHGYQRIGTGDDPEHAIEGVTCWCDPHVYQICEQCDGDGVSCWQCDGLGRGRCPDPEHYDGPHGLIIVHSPIPTTTTAARPPGEE
jgi:hypothetical protein